MQMPMPLLTLTNAHEIATSDASVVANTNADTGAWCLWYLWCFAYDSAFANAHPHAYACGVYGAYGAGGAYGAYGTCGGYGASAYANARAHSTKQARRPRCRCCLSAMALESALDSAL